MSSAMHSRILQEMHGEEYILLWVESRFQLNALELISEDKNFLGGMPPYCFVSIDANLVSNMKIILM